MNGENSDSNKISEEELISFNGMSDTDGSAKMFEFTCTDRSRDDTKDGWNYHVKPIDEYGDLDFKGHTVLINGKERVCTSFEVSEGSIIIFVAD